MIFKRGYGSLVREFFETEVTEDEALILFLRYSGVIVKALDKVLAFDPADLLGKEGINEIKQLNLMLYTHSHYDHFNYKECIDLFRKSGAYVVAEPSIIRELRGDIPSDKLIEASPSGEKILEDFKIYFIEGRHVGPIILYLVEYSGLRIFHGGDSAYVPLNVFKADIALLPVGSPSPTASPSDAFKMVTDLKPKVVIPIHGTESEVKRFEELIKSKYPDINVAKVREYSYIKVKFK